MAHLFSKRSRGAESDAVLAALLSIFSRYVRRMRKSKEGEEVYSWVRPRPGPCPPTSPAHGPAPGLTHPPPQSESQDQVFLRWTGGEAATMHILVVHAMVILLTLGPPQGEPRSWAGGCMGLLPLPVQGPPGHTARPVQQTGLRVLASGEACRQCPGAPPAPGLPLLTLSPALRLGVSQRTHPTRG